MRVAGFFIVLIIISFSCRREAKEVEYDNTIRNELAGVWRIHKIHNESFTVDSVKGITLTEFDTTYDGINSYYTLQIPTVKDQWSAETKGYGVLQNEYFDFLCQIETSKRKLSVVQFDLIFCQTCNLHSGLFIDYIMSSWNVKEYSIRDHLKLSRNFYVNGVKRESFLEFIYALPI